MLSGQALVKMKQVAVKCDANSTIRIEDDNAVHGTTLDITLETNRRNLNNLYPA